MNNVDEALGGSWTDNPRGFVVERRFPESALHGRVRVGDVAAELARATADPSALSILTGMAAAPAPLVFFDLETTGLSGGAGTYAFLVGVAWFEGCTFVVRQHLLHDYSAERPMLERVTSDLGRAGSLVSFNGKSFDAPLLDTRYLFHRIAWPGAGLPHVDALHLSRRFWRQAATGPRESCSLIALEEEILGVRRTGDVPGFEIPARYFQFIRSGDARPLAAVFEHNRIDLLSLAALTARLVQLVLEGPGSAESAWEALALGRSVRSRRADDASTTLRSNTWLRRAPGGAWWPSRRSSRRSGRSHCSFGARGGYDEAAGYWRRVWRCRRARCSWRAKPTKHSRYITSTACAISTRPGRLRCEVWETETTG